MSQAVKQIAEKSELAAWVGQIDDKLFRFIVENCFAEDARVIDCSR